MKANLLVIAIVWSLSVTAARSQSPDDSEPADEASRARHAVRQEILAAARDRDFAGVQQDVARLVAAARTSRAHGGIGEVHQAPGAAVPVMGPDGETVYRLPEMVIGLKDLEVPKIGFPENVVSPWR